jgi:formate--tetrahydrofolate ligase
MAVLLKDAIKPNLVQTLEGTPAIIHGGPFANIAQGTNSIIATKTGLSLSDFVVTEAGFASELGAEKFFDIKSQFGNLKTNAVVIVATIRALKYHGGAKLSTLQTEDLATLEKGFDNLDKHIENMKYFGFNPVIAVNRFTSDTDAEIDLLMKHCESKQVGVALNESWARGGEGAIDLAWKVIESIKTAPTVSNPFTICRGPLRKRSRPYAGRCMGQITLNILLRQRTSR